jgi:L-lactate dehydrogenase complex protein LldF
MVPSEAKKFTKAAEEIAFNKKHRNIIHFNIAQYNRAVQAGMSHYKDIEHAKEQAAAIERDVLQHWSEYLLTFEKNCCSNGTEVLWAEDACDAQRLITEIIKNHDAKLIVKSKSMTTEEIEFNEIAESAGCESIETDLGEFIVQVAGEKPYHIVTPAMHKSKEDIAHLFHEKFGLPVSSTPEEITAYARSLLRNKYLQADIGVTGANFLIADVGGVSVTENEGNALMSTAFPKVHIVIAGIEKIIPKLEQLALFYPLLAVHGTGQQMTVYNSIFTGPRQSDEPDGPEKMYVILLDNGRTKVYQDDEAFVSLACIRCGACLNVCPVYKTIGGHAYHTTYSGPIGSVLTPFLKGFKDFSLLSFASTLCGACNDVCPVQIPLTDLLLSNRRKSVEQGLQPLTEKLAVKGFSFISSNRSMMDFIPSYIKNIVTLPLNYFGWGPRRNMPDFAKKSFSAEMKKRNKQQ